MRRESVVLLLLVVVVVVVVVLFWGWGDGGVWGWFVFWPTLYLPDYKCYVKLSKMRRESVLLLFFRRRFLAGL